MRKLALFKVVAGIFLFSLVGVANPHDGFESNSIASRTFTILGSKAQFNVVVFSDKIQFKRTESENWKTASFPSGEEVTDAYVIGSRLFYAYRLDLKPTTYLGEIIINDTQIIPLARFDHVDFFRSYRVNPGFRMRPFFARIKLLRLESGDGSGAYENATVQLDTERFTGAAAQAGQLSDYVGKLFYDCSGQMRLTSPTRQIEN